MKLLPLRGASALLLFLLLCAASLYSQVNATITTLSGDPRTMQFALRLSW